MRRSAPCSLGASRQLLLLAVAWSCAPSAARAQSPSVATVVDPCVPVDAQQFGKLLSIELGTSIDYRATGSDTPGLTQVALSCTEQGIELRLQDGVTRKSMVRVLDISRIEPASRTRLLALAVAEFVVASWVELRIVDKPAVEPVGPAPGPAARAVAAGVVGRRVREVHAAAPAAAEPAYTPWELSGLFRLEGWSGDPGLAPAAALRMAHRPVSNLALVLGADFSATRVAVDLGQVDVGMTSVLAAVLFVVHASRVDLYAGGGGRFGFVHMAGLPSDPRVRGLSFVSPYGGALMLGRLAYHVTSVFRLLAEVEGGIVTLPAEGRSGPRLVVDLNGAWLSGAVGLGFAF